uniref:hypothetical protein n=1 Tax=Paenibacillus zanthoxyli TaxID=369399 RepID=UPI001E576C2B|nr:hypothetical protein [Paenibacillus zanthoxyli]
MLAKKVTLYAYTQLIYSSRQITKAARETIPFMWLADASVPASAKLTVKNLLDSTPKNIELWYNTKRCYIKQYYPH